MADNRVQSDPNEYDENLNQGNGNLDNQYGDDPVITNEDNADAEEYHQFDPNTVLTDNHTIDEDEESINDDNENDDGVDFANKSSKPSSAELVEYQPSRDDEDLEEDDNIDDDDLDDQSEMIVLDPDHPLMKRFQAALRKQLTKQYEKVNLELREMQETVKKKKLQREELGVSLYNLQQELAKQQTSLEKEHDDFNQLYKNRQASETDLNETRQQYKQLVDKLDQLIQKRDQLQSEMEKTAAQLTYMENAKRDIKSDIAVMRRAAEKANEEISKAEEEKQQQDLFINRITEVIQKQEEKIRLYEAQCKAQTEETKAARTLVSDATTEIESINFEKKQLMQQWNSSLIGLRRRDEALAGLRKAIDLQQQQLLAYDTEIAVTKKSIEKEQKQNEGLTLINNKNEAELILVKKQITTSQQKLDSVKIDYSKMNRTLREIEQHLNKVTADVVLKNNDLIALRKNIERVYDDKVKLQSAIEKELYSRQTIDKASKYSKKVTSKIRQTLMSKENEVAAIENEISHTVLSTAQCKNRLEKSNQQLDQYNQEIREKNKLIGKYESSVNGSNATIEKKQTQIDQLNKKIEKILSSREGGGEELGPLEIQIKTLLKQIESLHQENEQLKQFWLRGQNELVKHTKEREEQGDGVESLKKQFTVLNQKKLRIENQIQSEEKEIAEVSHSTRNLRNEMIKLNMLISKKNNQREDMEQSNILMESEFIKALKEAEIASMEMDNNLQMLNEEKERLLSSLVEAERQIMLWEKKTQLAKEMRAAVDSETGQGEIKAMKMEIHRMEVRYGQLCRQQEKMIQDMEKSVFKRECIVTRSDAQAKTGRNENTKRAFQKNLVEIKKKIKKTTEDVANGDGELKRYREMQVQLSQDLESKKESCHTLQRSIDAVEADVDQMAEMKQKNFSEILEGQQRVKYYQELKDGKYRMLCKTHEGIDNEWQRQHEKTQSLNTLIDRLNQEYPYAQSSLRKVTQMISNKMTTLY
ncbi:Coiled-coil domain-containing protein 40 [Trichoplax sp. H2]|nr:Coiled-coil domain-containing protein 40 [Trichoplax sp. H2]|eukprot:RDD45702.1 Coiled-coil domain-containing protein 40 [Trichoplax sp. H2]